MSVPAEHARALPFPPLDIAEWTAMSQRSPAEAAKALHDRISHNLQHGQRHAVFAQLPPESALEGRIRDAALHGGPLAGVPYFLKDLYDIQGLVTCAGSSFLQGVCGAADDDASIVQDLRQAGAACVGKTQLHEFAYGLTGENPHHGNCSHPLHPDRSTGGSSSGSAAVVAAGIVPFAIGTDTGGSIRLPAAFCGLYGFRGTPGHRWIRDAFPLAPSCDTAGWFTRSAKDLALLNRVLLGEGKSLRALRLLQLPLGRLDPEVAEAFSRAAGALTHRTDRDSAAILTHAFEGASHAYTVLTSAEAADVHHDWLDVQKPHYGAGVWQRIDRGRHWSPNETAQALMVRQRIRDTFISFFLSYDALILPASPCAALRHAECRDFDRTRILDLTAPASLAGLPVLTLPVPLPGGLSTGLQVIVPSSQSPVISQLL